MSLGNKSKKRNSKERNRKRLRRNAIERASRDEKELREVVNDLGVTLRQIDEQVHLIGTVIKIYQPKLSEEDNRVLTNPFGVLARDLSKCHVAYSELHQKANNFYVRASLNNDISADIKSLDNTLNAVNLLQEADNISTTISTSVVPLMFDCNEQCRYLMEVHGTDDFENKAWVATQKMLSLETQYKMNAIKENLND